MDLNNYFLLGFLDALFVVVAAYFILMFVSSMVKGAPFMISGKRAIKKIIELSNIQAGQKAVDLGSGDGRIVIAFAKAGAIAYGYEINPILVWLSKRKIKKEGLQDKAFIYQKSFWDANFSLFDIVSIYGIDYIMSDLEKKLHQELKPGSKVLANAFTFPRWKPVKKDDPVYLYEKK